MATVNRLSMIILMQQDIDKAVTFYQTLGCTLRFKLPGQWAELSLADMIIGLCPTSQPSEPRRTGLVFAVDDVQAFYNVHKDTLQFLNEPVIKTHGGMVSMQDPYGNIIDLYQATPEKVQEILKKNCSKNPCCKENKEPATSCCKA
ncbi:MAG TPA: VOC family protein [Candidatus Babeliales bacterium]|jgi:predicted enzyme related to lactoylglutathione lyase|nr:VOC family protein [Candidatus Babeliales bacterium]